MYLQSLLSFYIRFPAEVFCFIVVFNWQDKMSVLPYSLIPYNTCILQDVLIKLKSRSHFVYLFNDEDTLHLLRKCQIYNTLLLTIVTPYSALPVLLKFDQCFFFLLAQEIRMVLTASHRPIILIPYMRKSQISFFLGGAWPISFSILSRSTHL